MEVEWEDQQKINEFSKLNARLDANLAASTKLQQQKEDLDDVEMEIELVDEDEKMMFQLGEVFVYLSQSQIVERLEKQRQDLELEMENNATAKTKIEERMSELKTVLYARFGKSINLERE